MASLAVLSLAFLSFALSTRSGSSVHARSSVSRRSQFLRKRGVRRAASKTERDNEATAREREDAASRESQFARKKEFEVAPPQRSCSRVFFRTMFSTSSISVVDIVVLLKEKRRQRPGGGGKPRAKKKRMVSPEVEACSWNSRLAPSPCSRAFSSLSTRGATRCNTLFSIVWRRKREEAREAESSKRSKRKQREDTHQKDSRGKGRKARRACERERDAAAGQTRKKKK